MTVNLGQWWAAGALFLAAWASASPGWADEPTPPPAADVAVDTSGAAEVLAQFEAAGKALKTVHCGVVYSTDDKLNATTTTKTGSILFKRAEPNPMFLIAFTETVSDGIRFREKEWWLFRDRWLWEAKGKSQVIIKRELFAPGEKFNLFDLDESPVPMPFGQTQREVLDRFNVRLMPAQVGDPENTDHLYCLPREGGRLARDYRRLEYYISKTTRLPVRIVAEDANQSKVTVAEFRDADAGGGQTTAGPLSAKSIDVNIPDSAFRLPDETSSYHVSEEPRDADDQRGRD